MGLKPCTRRLWTGLSFISFSPPKENMTDTPVITLIDTCMELYNVWYTWCDLKDCLTNTSIHPVVAVPVSQPAPRPLLQRLLAFGWASHQPLNFVLQRTVTPTSQGPEVWMIQKMFRGNGLCKHFRSSLATERSQYSKPPKGNPYCIGLSYKFLSCVMHMCGWGWTSLLLWDRKKHCNALHPALITIFDLVLRTFGFHIEELLWYRLWQTECITSDLDHTGHVNAQILNHPSDSSMRPWLTSKSFEPLSPVPSKALLCCLSKCNSRS